MAESTEETSQRKSWYREGDNGSFHLVRYLTPATLNDLSTAARAALSMTDICCDRGHGRVYVLVSHRKPKGDPEEWTELARVPQIYYTPEPWPKDEVDNWRSRGWRWQMSRICSQNNWIAEQCLVLPLRLTVQDKQLNQPRFDALANAPINLYFAPQPYLGLVGEMEEVGKAGYYQDTKHGGGVTRYSYTVPGGKKGWEKLEQWHMADIHAVLDKLEEIFWDDDGNLLIQYGVLWNMFLSATETKSQDLQEAEEDIVEQDDENEQQQEQEHEG